MTTETFDVTELLRAGLKTWWIANNATLSALGTPIIAADDGSPASTETGDLPTVVIRLGDASPSGITNNSRLSSVPVTFQVFGNTRSEASASAKPLDSLLCGMADSRSSVFSLSEGSITGVAVNRFGCTQLSKMRWRADREVEFTIRVDRKPS